MAIYHFSSQIISRGKGRSSIAAAAYRSAEKIVDQVNNKVFDYTNKIKDVFHKEIMFPQDSPERISDRGRLWNYVEQNEIRKDAQLAREVTLALPKELSKEAQVTLGREFIQRQFVNRGMVADVCFHKGHGDEQPHVHVMLTMRKISRGGFGMKEVLWNSKASLCEWREEWANVVNKHLALAGIDLRVDHRSNVDREIDLEPQRKIGPKVARDRFGDNVAEHLDIAKRNGERILDDPSIALKALTLQQSTFTHEDLARFVNRHTVDAEQFRVVYERVRNCEGIVRLGVDDSGRERFTSKEMLDLEYKMVNQAYRLTEKSHHRVSFGYREVAILDYGLSENQAEAFRHITGDRDLACIVGYAGSGKSYMLGAARKMWEGAGYKVIGMTLSGIAAENLEASSGIRSYTVANRVTNWEHDRERLSRGDVVVVDEAGMLGSRDLGKIILEAMLANSKVVLIGDPEQLQAIQAGAAFRGIIERVGCLELSEIKRQKEGWQREATRCLALGCTRDALQAYQQNDMVHEFGIKEDAIGKMVQDWHELSLESPEKTSIMLAFRRSEVRLLNESVRVLKKHYGELCDGKIFDTSNGKREFAIGDRVYFLGNDRNLGVKNGTIGIVQGIEGYGLKVVLDKGGEVSFDIREYDKIDHGYAATIHKAQGVTVDRTFVLGSELFNRHVAYVGLSRHREVVDLYWSKDQFRDFNHLISVFERERLKDLSLDYGIYKESPDIDKGSEFWDKVVDIVREDYPDVRFTVDRNEISTVAVYMGDVELDGKTISIFTDNKTAYVLEDVRKEGILVNGDVRLVMEVVGDQEQIRAIEKYQWIRTRTPEYMKEQEYKKAELFINKVERGLSSREHKYKINETISTRDLYGALYEQLPQVLSEFGFMRKGNCLVSTTGCKIDGSYGQNGKVYVYANNAGVLVDYTRGNMSIWEYVGQREGLVGDKARVFEYLAVAAGLRGQFERTVDVLKEHRKAPEMVTPTTKVEWGRVYDYALSKMQIPNNQVVRYLLNERGYRMDEVGKMGVGYIPNKRELSDHLRVGGMGEAEIKEINKALGMIGYTHKLVVPYYDPNGEIIGFAARNTKDTDGSKYVYTKGLSRNGTMFGIHEIDTNKLLILVEGIFDALNAKAKGIGNVVALGGSSIGIGQLDLLEKLRIQEVIMCFDNDAAGIKATRSVSLLIAEHNPRIGLKQFQLPSSVKDLDQCLQILGVEKTLALAKTSKYIDIDSLKLERSQELQAKFVNHPSLQKEVSLNLD